MPAKEDNKDDDGDDDSDDSDDSDASSNSDSEEGEVSPDSKDKTTPRGRHRINDSPPSKKRGRSSLSQRRNEEQHKARELAAQRRRKEVRLNTLTSISGAGAPVQQQKASFACHRCGKSGHKMAECPQGGGSKKGKR